MAASTRHIEVIVPAVLPIARVEAVATVAAVGTRTATGGTASIAASVAVTVEGETSRKSGTATIAASVAVTVTTVTAVTVVGQPLVNNVILYEPSVTTAAGTAQTTVLPVLSVTPSLFEPTVGRHTEPAGMWPAPWSVKIVDMVGNVTDTLTYAIPKRITRTLNEPDAADVDFPKHAYTASQIPVLGTASGVREVQLYRDGDLLFWGPIIQADTSGSDGAVACNCAGVDWYMNRRAIDGARTNLLTNPSFEDDLDGWTVNSVPGFSVAVSTFRKVLGTKSLAMYGGDPNAEQFISQTFFHPSTTIGNLLTLSAWYWIEALISPNLISPRGRGAFIEYLIDGAIVDYDMIPIDEGISPIGEWTRGEIELWIPPGGAVIDVRLYCPHGAIYWDAVQLVAMESVSTAGLTESTVTEVDVARIIPMLVTHVQNTEVGKSDLNVGWGLTGGDTGVTMAKHYQYADHVAFDQAIGEFIERDDIGDYSVEITPNTRTFTLHTPRKGVDRTATHLTFGGNVADYRFVGDGAGAVTRATVLGTGDGPDREEGEYANAAAVGGLILQDIRTAPAKTTINSLLPLAQDVVSRHGRAEHVIEVDVLPSAGIIHTVDVGDTVTLTINDGWVTVTGAAFRVVGWDLDCATDVLTLTLNEGVTVPGAAQIPDLERQLASLIARVETLERQRATVGPPEPEPAVTGGGVTSYTYLIGTDVTTTEMDTANWTQEFTLHIEDHCGDEDVTLHPAGFSVILNTDGIYSVSYELYVTSTGPGNEFYTADGWQSFVETYSAMHPPQGGNFWGPCHEGPLRYEFGGWPYAGVMLSWRGRLESGDFLRAVGRLYNATGIFTFNSINLFIVRHGDST